MNPTKSIAPLKTLPEAYNININEIIPNIDAKKTALFQAHYLSTQFHEFKKQEDFDELSEQIGILGAYVGYNIQGNEIILINQFIRKTFPSFNLEDVKEAINMVADGSIQTEYHGTLSPLYVGKVLSEFKRIRNEFFHDIRYQIREHNRQLPLPKPSPEATLQIFLTILENAHKDAKAGTFTDGGSLIYDHLLKHKLIDFSKTNVEMAEAYAKKHTSTKRKQSVFKSVIQNTAMPERSSGAEIKLLKREYVVNKWLRSKSYPDMKAYMEKLQPEDV